MVFTLSQNEVTQSQLISEQNISQNEPKKEILVQIDEQIINGNKNDNKKDENKDNKEDAFPVLTLVGLSHTYSSELPICRICHCGEGDNDSSDVRSSVNEYPTVSSISPAPETLIAPCYCSGSLRYVHHYCLQQWIRSSNNKYCELCKYHFKMSIKYKPVHKWERLEMSASERKKLIYNLIFNIISMFCVFWSIYVLIERAAFEIKHGLLKWPFWTRMLVVSIGFLGGTLFLFVQFRIYLSIFLRWRQYNRVIIIHSNNNCDSNVPRDNNPLINEIHK